MEVEIDLAVAVGLAAEVQTETAVIELLSVIALPGVGRTNHGVRLQRPFDRELNDILVKQLESALVDGVGNLCQELES